MTAFFSLKAHQVTFNRIVNGGAGKAGGVNSDVVDKILVQEVVSATVIIVQHPISELIHINDLLGLAVFCQIQDAFICVTVDRTLFYPSSTVATMVFLGGVVGWF